MSSLDSSKRWQVGHGVNEENRWAFSLKWNHYPRQFGLIQTPRRKVPLSNFTQTIGFRWKLFMDSMGTTKMADYQMLSFLQPHPPFTPTTGVQKIPLSKNTFAGCEVIQCWNNLAAPPNPQIGELRLNGILSGLVDRLGMLWSSKTSGTANSFIFFLLFNWRIPRFGFLSPWLKFIASLVVGIRPVVRSPVRATQTERKRWESGSWREIE